MKLLDPIIKAKTLVTPEKANALALQLTEEDEYLDYVAVHDPKGTGLSYVKVIDRATEEEIGVL